MFDEEERMYQEIVDMLDVKYIDGEAYMSIHTVDIINDSFMELIERSENPFDPSVPVLPDVAKNGMVWVMTIWRLLHDELEIRADATTIPDTPEELLED